MPWVRTDGHVRPFLLSRGRGLLLFLSWSCCPHNLVSPFRAGRSLMTLALFAMRTSRSPDHAVGFFLQDFFSLLYVLIILFPFLIRTLSFLSCRSNVPRKKCGSHKGRYTPPFVDGGLFSFLIFEVEMKSLPFKCARFPPWSSQQ